MRDKHATIWSVLSVAPRLRIGVSRNPAGPTKNRSAVFLLWYTNINKSMGNQNKKHVVIIGGGFGGIAAALEMAKKKPHFELTVIDERPYHLIHGNLYELASSPEELQDMLELKSTVAIPFKKIFAHKKIKFIQARVIKVDTEKNEVELEHGKVSYDYLVCSLGAHPNFYSIPGAEERAIPLFSLGDALRIRDKVEFMVQAHKNDMAKDVVRVMIAGGSFSGVEIAGELQGMFDFIAWKNNYPRNKIEVVIVEGAHQLMPGFGNNVSEDIQNRLESFGVRIMTNRMIQRVDDHMAEFTNGEKLDYDVLIWAAGVKAMTLPMSLSTQTDHTDRIEVDEYFRINRSRNIFVIGDQSCHHKADGKPLPGTASQAIDQGKYIAYAIGEFARNKHPHSHVCKDYPMLVPVGGKWAIYKSKNFYLKGYLPYFIRRMVWLFYYADLLGAWNASKMYLRNEEIYSEND